MKIFFLSLMNGSHWGGSEEIWFRLATWMAKNGHEVGAACYDWPEKKDKLDELSRAGVSLYRLPRDRNFFGRIELNKRLKAIPFETYDLVFVNQGGYKEVVYPSFQKLNTRFKKYILAFHNYDAGEKMKASRKKILKHWMEHAGLNAGAAGRIFEVIEKNFGIITSKKQVWPNPLTIDPPSVPTPYPATAGNYVFSVLAELDLARKAQDLLIETLSAPKWKERNWELHLYGKGKDEEAIANLIRRHQMENRIFLQGFSRNVKEVLNRTHLLIQCTRIDAMPLSVVEAMAMSRPCLVTDVGDMTQWVQNGINGFVCRGISPEALDLALEKCWQLRHQWEQAGKNAFQTFLEKYPQPYEKTMAARLEAISNGDLSSVTDL